MEEKAEKYRKIIWLSSLIVLGVSLLCPTYCTDAHCSGPLSGLIDGLFGWLGALFYGDTYVAWFANPFLIAAIFTNKRVPFISFVFSAFAVYIAFHLLKGGSVILNEAGHTAYITKLQIGYWLWTISMELLFIASCFPLVASILTYFKNKSSNLQE